MKCSCNYTVCSWFVGTSHLRCETHCRISCKLSEVSRGLVNIHRMLRDLFYKTNITICRQKQLKKAQINASLHNFTLITIFQTTPNISVQLKTASFVNYESKRQHLIGNYAFRLSLPSCSRWNQGKNQKLPNLRGRKQEKEEATLPIVPNQTALPSLPNVLRWRRRPMENPPNLYLLYHWNFMCYSLAKKSKYTFLFCNSCICYYLLDAIINR